jgi:hypothetical protein
MREPFQDALWLSTFHSAVQQACAKAGDADFPRATVVVEHVIRGAVAGAMRKLPAADVYSIVVRVADDIGRTTAKGKTK